MNIRDSGMMPDTVPDNTPEAWNDLFLRRQKTFMGFCEREKEKGFIKCGTPFDTSEGQEMVRILMFRTLEELVESADSCDEDHILEELIDAINYLWSIIFVPFDELTPEAGYPWGRKFADKSLEWLSPVLASNTVAKPSLEEIGEATTLLGHVGDFLRNRAWMANVQDVYFAGYDELMNAIEGITRLCVMHFFDWEQFYKFFVAKDNVLQFRLDSNY